MPMQGRLALHKHSMKANKALISGATALKKDSMKLMLDAQRVREGGKSTRALTMSVVNSKNKVVEE